MLDQTIQRAVARDPARRFQTATELREALAAALREPVRARQRRRRLGYAVLGSFAVAVAAMTVVGLRTPDARARAADFVKPAIEQIRGFRAQISSAADQPVAELAQVEADHQVPITDAKLTAPAGTSEPAADIPPTDTLAAAPAELPAPDGAEADAAQAHDEVTAMTDQPRTLEGAADPAQAAADGAVPTQTTAEPAGLESAPGKLEDQLAEAAEMMEKGNWIVALNRFRTIGKTHSKSPLALKAWSEAAKQTKGWGEAYQVALQWAYVDGSPEARLHLARMQRAVGKREDALTTLKGILQDDPTYDPARDLLQVIAGPDIVAMQ